MAFSNSIKHCITIGIPALINQLLECSRNSFPLSVGMQSMRLGIMAG